jgi:hypothetical protein
MGLPHHIQQARIKKKCAKGHFNLQQAFISDEYEKVNKCYLMLKFVQFCLICGSKIFSADSRCSDWHPSPENFDAHVFACLA